MSVSLHGKKYLADELNLTDLKVTTLDEQGGPTLITGILMQSFSGSREPADLKQRFDLLLLALKVERAPRNVGSL